LKKKTINGRPVTFFKVSLGADDRQGSPVEVHKGQLTSETGDYRFTMVFVNHICDAFKKDSAKNARFDISDADLKPSQQFAQKFLAPGVDTGEKPPASPARIKDVVEKPSSAATTPSPKTMLLMENRSNMHISNPPLDKTLISNPPILEQRPKAPIPNPLLDERPKTLISNSPSEPLHKAPILEQRPKAPIPNPLLDERPKIARPLLDEVEDMPLTRSPKPDPEPAATVNRVFGSQLNSRHLILRATKFIDFQDEALWAKSQKKFSSFKTDTGLSLPSKWLLGVPSMPALRVYTVLAPYYDPEKPKPFKTLYFVCNLEPVTEACFGFDADKIYVFDSPTTLADYYFNAIITVNPSFEVDMLISEKSFFVSQEPSAPWTNLATIADRPDGDLKRKRDDVNQENGQKRPRDEKFHQLTKDLEEAQLEIETMTRDHSEMVEKLTQQIHNEREVTDHLTTQNIQLQNQCQRQKEIINSKYTVSDNFFRAFVAIDDTFKTLNKSFRDALQAMDDGIGFAKNEIQKRDSDSL
jgi:hypothetical protein